MSRHEIINDNGRFVIGWDQMLMSFFLHLHDDNLEIDDKNPVIWVGATKDTSMYEVEDLVKVAAKNGLNIDQKLQNVLYLDKDEGR